MPCTRPCGIAVMPRLTAFSGVNRGSRLGPLGLFAQLVDRRQVTFTHTLDKALERHIGDAYQAEVAVFAVQQTTGDRLVSDRILAAPGVTYTLSYWYKSAAGRARIYIYFFDDDTAGSVLSSPNLDGGISAGWSQVTLSQVAPAGTKSIAIDIRTTGLAVGESVYYDDVTLTTVGESSGLILGDTLQRMDTAGAIHELLIYPTRATLWHHESIVTSGNALAFVALASTMFGGAHYQNVSANGNTFTQSFVLKAGTYTLSALGMTWTNTGKIDWYIDDTLAVSGQDWYAAAQTTTVVKTASVTVVGNGRHVLKGVVNGKNGSSSGYNMYLCKMWLAAASDVAEV